MSGSTERKVWYLRHVDLFASLTDEEIEEIAEALGDHHVPEGTELLRDCRGERVYIIKEGIVRIHSGNARDEVTLALLGPGKAFGLSSAIGEGGSHLSATTLTSSYVCFASWPAMMEVSAHHPAVMVKMMAALAERLFKAETWSTRLGMSSPCHRLASLLVELTDEFGEPSTAGRRIRFRLTQTDLARMVGLSRETVSRQMAEFTRLGWVVRENGLLVLRDHDAVAACGDTDAA